MEISLITECMFLLVCSYCSSIEDICVCKKQIE